MIKESRATSNALNKPTAAELEAIKDTSTKIARIFGGDNKNMPNLINVAQLPLNPNAEIPMLGSTKSPFSQKDNRINLDSKQ